MQKIAVIGNGGGGKTTLSLALAHSTGLPLCEVDKLQFQEGWAPAPPESVTEALSGVMSQPGWLIDGFGPWASIERRFDEADAIFFVDFPFWQHCAWACERQISAAFGLRRLGGPDGCDLRGITDLMYQALWRVQEEIRPRLIELAERHEAKMQWIRSPDELNARLAELGWTKTAILDGLRMSPAAPGRLGDEATLFHFRQAEGVVTAGYAGGGIEAGTLVGAVKGAGLEFQFSHLTASGELDGGRMTADLEQDPEGQWRLAFRPEGGVLEERRL